MGAVVVSNAVPGRAIVDGSSKTFCSDRWLSGPPPWLGRNFSVIPHVEGHWNVAAGCVSWSRRSRVSPSAARRRYRDGAFGGSKRSRRRRALPRLGQRGWRICGGSDVVALLAMNRGAGNTQSCTGSHRTQLGNGLDSGGHEVRPSLYPRSRSRTGPANDPIFPRSRSFACPGSTVYIT